MAFQLVNPDLIRFKFKPTVSKKQAAIYIFLSGFFLVMFFAFTLLVRSDVLRHFDFNMTVRIQNHVPFRADPFFSWLSVVGRFEWVMIGIGIILLLRRQLLGIIIIGLIGFGHLLEIVGKSMLNQPGPPNMFLRSKYSEFPGLYVHTDASYPSGHSMRAIILGMLLTAIIFEMKKLPLIIRAFLISIVGSYTVLMIFSRVSLGEHWTTDVVGGTLLGLSIGFMSLVFL